MRQLIETLKYLLPRYIYRHQNIITSLFKDQNTMFFLNYVHNINIYTFFFAQISNNIRETKVSLYIKITFLIKYSYFKYIYLIDAIKFTMHMPNRIFFII